jgi:sugar phosphate isomerase/epimerase
MRIGAPVPALQDPAEWISMLRERCYSAAYCPVTERQPADVVQAFAKAAFEADIVIAEVGAWSNPLSPTASRRREALTLCQERLALADAVGARCCVNISGSRGEEPNGRRAPHPDNLTRETFDLIVEAVRAIIDAVKPVRAFYTLEVHPWLYPNSADSYLDLIRAVDRSQFGVHLDPVNILSSPERYYGNSAILRECLGKLGPHIKSCHGKDTILRNQLTIDIDEIRPGLGALDYHTFLRELDRLDPDTPLMLEHLAEDEYPVAVEYIRSVAQEVGATIKTV